LTVPLAIQSTDRAGHLDSKSAGMAEDLPKLSVRLEKASSISRFRQKRQEDSNTFISNRIRLVFFF
jgi:hypothetical protein